MLFESQWRSISKESAMVYCRGVDDVNAVSTATKKFGRQALKSAHQTNRNRRAAIRYEKISPDQGSNIKRNRRKWVVMRGKGGLMEYKEVIANVLVHRHRSRTTLVASVLSPRALREANPVMICDLIARGGFLH